MSMLCDRDVMANVTVSKRVVYLGDAAQPYYRKLDDARPLAA